LNPVLLRVPYLAVVVPAYNEEPRILPTLQRISEFLGAQDYSWSVTVVSDGSTDKTNEIVSGFCATNACFKLISYSPNRGKGYAVRKGMLAADGEVVLISDADLAAPIEELDKLLKPVRDGFPVAIGSRPLKDSELVVHQPFLREMFGRASNKIIQLLGVRGIHDTQCGFKLFTHNAAQEVFTRCKLNGFSFDFEALVVAHDLGLKISEVPIRWAHQEGSKVVLWRDAPKALFDLVKLRLAGKKARTSPNPEESAR
jgi:dolichyl-phosphate beta-glucosyltransferase